MLLNPLPEGQYRITQKYGERPQVYAVFGMKGHNGIDFAPKKPGDPNQKIYAPHEGYVRVFFDPNGYGKYVEITSMPYNNKGHQRCSTLAHFASIDVKDGQYIGMGDCLGIMGKTGFADGIHTHWTYRIKLNQQVLDYSNGYKGAVNLDLKKSIVYWTM